MNAAQTTRTVKATLVDYVGEISSVNTRWLGRRDYVYQTIVNLNADGWKNSEAIHAFAVGAFSECKVTLSTAGFISISWPQ